MTNRQSGGPRVSVAPCADYDPARVERALCAALEPLGGLDWVQSGMTVAVKANLVSFLRPERAATTHPAPLCALVRLLRARGARVIVGDSPGGLYNAAYVGRVYAATGMKLVEEAGAELNHDFGQKTAEYPEARVAGNFQYTAWLDQADAIIDFCKLKTHGMMAMSGAAKNMFGVIPGTLKPEYHFKYPNQLDFAHMIVDLDEYFKPRLSIADAVVGMEGNGPTMGTPRPIGALLASENPHALDLACARLIGLTAAQVPTLQAAQERGLIPGTVEELDLVGELEPLVVADYRRIENSNDLLFKRDADTAVGRLLGRVIQRALCSVPVLDPACCVGCGECFRICPAKAITMEASRPVIDRRACIHCFCCQEFCPKGAMKVHRPLPARLLNQST